MKRVKKFLLYGASISVLAALQTSYVAGLFIDQPSAHFLLAVSLYVAMIQVGQATALQVTLHHVEAVTARFGLLRTFVIIAVLATLAPLGVRGTTFTCIGIVGAITGCVFSIQNSHNLQAGSEDKYFSALLLRNALLALGVLASAKALGGAPLSVHAAGSVLAFAHLAYLAKANPNAVGLPLSTLRPLAFGMGASSLYRNDQNMVRSFAAGFREFSSVHNSLIAVAATQAAAGSLMNTVGLSVIRSQRRRAVGSVDFITLGVAAAAMTGGVLLCLTGNKSAGILAAGVIIAMNQWSANTLHFKKRSTYVYSAGTLSVVFLYGMMVVGVNPSTSYLAYAGVTFTLIWCGNRAWKE